MKKILLTALVLAGFSATAQVKVGSNPTTLATNAKFQVEGSTGAQTVILDNGNVGIGTTTPEFNLHLETKNFGTALFLENTESSVATYPFMHLRNYLGGTVGQNVFGMSIANGTKASPLSINGYRVVGMINGSAYANGGFREAGRISIATTNTFGDADYSGSLFFETNNGTTRTFAASMGSKGMNVGPAAISGKARLSVDGYLILKSSDVVGDALATEADKMGLIRYNSGLQYHDGTAWNTVGTTAGASASKWTNDATNTLVKLTNLSDNTTARTAGTEFVVKDNGNVGIGTTTPGNKLHVYGTVLNGGETVMKLSSADAGWSQGTGDGVSLDFAQWNNSVSRVKAGVWSGSGNFDLGFMTGVANVTSDTPQMILIPNGNVGIGTIAPSTKLHIWDDFNGSSNVRVENPNGGTGAFATMSVVASGNVLNNYSFGSNYTTSGRFVQRSSLVEATGEGGLGLSASNATLGKIAFYTAGNNERMRISETGNVGIGTTTPTNKLEVSGGIVATGEITGLIAGSTTLERMSNGRSRILSVGNSVVQNGAIELCVTNSDATNYITALYVQTNGNVGIGTAGPTSKLQVVGLPVYADNAAAVAGGLTVGAVYHAGDGIMRVVF